MVALVTGVGDFYFLGFKVFGHGHGFDDRVGSGFYFGIVTSKAQGGDFGVFFNREGANLFTVVDMVSIGAMAKFAGDSLVAALEMNGCFIGMAYKARGVGAMANGSLNLLINGIGSVMAVGSKGIGNELGLYHKSHSGGNPDDDHRDDQSKFIVRKH